MNRLLPVKLHFEAAGAFLNMEKSYFEQRLGGGMTAT